MRAVAGLAARSWLLLPLVMLTSCSFDKRGFLAPTGPIAQAERDHFFSIIGWVLIVIVPLFVAVPIVLWKYRLGKTGSTYRPTWSFSWTLEILIWGIPLVIVGILSWNLLQVAHKLDPYKPIPSDKPPLHIQVVSLDWKWLFIYPDQGVAAVNTLELPLGRPISFSLTSATVMQSFMIPRLGSQIYTMGGMVTHLHLLAAEPGTYRGENTQYNGKGFADQKFKAHVVDAKAFKHWIAEQQSKPPLDSAAYRQIAKRSILPSPKIFGDVPPTLFHNIVARVKSAPASALPGAAPKAEDQQRREKKRLKKQRRDYQREQGA